jgi:arylsulfatase A-like enzyme/Tfp pilus assembly protein PilF
LLGAAACVSFALLAWWLQRPPRNEAQARARVLRQDPRPQDLNVLIVTLDTLRADRLGCYGYRGIATPHIDGLAREGVVFEHLTSSVPLTFPAHASLFTGLIPPHHRVRDNGGFFLDESHTTLAERFKEAGYATGAFVAAWVLEARWGLAQGFERYSDRFDLSQYKVISLGTVQKRGDQVADDALAWLDSVSTRKFFAWVHLYDPHTPYDPPEPYRSRHPDAPYLGEVEYTDHVVGRLLDGLRQRGLYERTLIVLTADHGESLGEHGEATHAYFIYDATMAVPLVIRTPWGLSGRSATQASQVDLYPTVLDLAGLTPQEGVDGRPLTRALFDPRADLGHVAYSESYFPRYHFGWQHLRGLRDGRHKLIEAPTPELYDVQADPGELSNIHKAFSKRAQGLRERMNGLVREQDRAAPERQSMDPETLQRLAALGYVGHVVETDPDAVLPDPKDKLRLFQLMNQAKGAAADERLDDAVAKMRRVLAEDPGIVDAHVTLGNWLGKLGRTPEAIEAFKQALALRPEDEVALVNLANAYRTRAAPGDDEAALELFRGTLQINARNPQAWFQLATLHLDLGRTREAEATFREALQANPQLGAAYNALGALAYQRNELAEAERLVRRGLELEHDVRTGRFNLARILEARGHDADAERLYRAELELYADHGRARFNLAQLLRARGDRAGYLAQLREGVAKAPEFGPCFFFLAREELDAGRLEDAMQLARRGLAVDTHSEVAPLGHYVLADVYSRRGDRARAELEAQAGRRLERARRAHPGPAL